MICYRDVGDESEAQEMDYAEQTALIAMRAKLALVNRQIKELSQAKKTIALDHSSANAQLILAEASCMAIYSRVIVLRAVLMEAGFVEKCPLLFS